jgi:hypothetical protein
VIARVGGDAEEIYAGWWPGNDQIASPAFYAYAYPQPAGIDGVTVRPDQAAWSPDAGEFLFPYEAARSAADPPRAVLDFLESTYAGAAALMDWDRDLTDVTAPTAR